MPSHVQISVSVNVLRQQRDNFWRTAEKNENSDYSGNFSISKFIQRTLQPGWNFFRAIAMQQFLKIAFQSQMKNCPCSRSLTPYKARREEGRKGGREGGAQILGWPNSQLWFRNLLFYDAHTLWLLVFIFKTSSGQILAKLISGGGGGGGLLLLFSHQLRRRKNFENENNFSLLENYWNWHGGSIFGQEERFWTQNTFFNETHLPGVNIRIKWLRRKFCGVILPKIEKLPGSNFASGMLLWLY